ncbi:MAG TPA: ABC transporter permease [Planctomycetes bacterium]|nr:ABC transporter permease [Planctomycetota bacterium]HIN80133.1 ABC transporter permease [Planctomycetota bacterium]
MLTFSIRRLLSIPPLLLGVALITFMLLKAAPGDFYSQMEADPARSLDEVLAQKENSGIIRRLEIEELLAIGEFRDDGHQWHFGRDTDGGVAVFRDGEMVGARVAARSLFKFQVGIDRFQSDESGTVYRKIGPIEGFGRWLGNALVGDFGTSYKYKQAVFPLIAERLWNTLTLSLAALFLAWGLSIPLGVLAAVRPNSLADHSCGLIAFLGLSIPSVFFALLAVLLASWTGWFPIGDMRSLDYDKFSFFGKIVDRLHHLVLPTIVIGTGAMAGYMRQARGNMIEALGQDYVRTARAKGLSSRVVLFKHALRNAINPLVTLFGYSLAYLLSGSFLVEVVMNWPGMARLIVDAIIAKDEPVVIASVMMTSVLLVLGNLVADLMLAVVDPRVRLS